MSKNQDLEFEAILDKFIKDDDGECTLILKVSHQDRLSAFAVPEKKRLWITVKILK